MKCGTATIYGLHVSGAHFSEKDQRTAIKQALFIFLKGQLNRTAENLFFPDLLPVVSGHVDSFEFICPSSEISISEFLPLSQYSSNERNFMCGAQSTDRIHFKNSAPTSLFRNSIQLLTTTYKTYSEKFLLESFYCRNAIQTVVSVFSVLSIVI